MMNKLIVLMFVFLMSGIVSAHPGRTASDGCHYCRTNCDKWGVPWNARHCHNSNTDASLTSVNIGDQRRYEDMRGLDDMPGLSQMNGLDDMPGL